MSVVFTPSLFTTVATTLCRIRGYDETPVVLVARVFYIVVPYDFVWSYACLARFYHLSFVKRR